MRRQKLLENDAIWFLAFLLPAIALGIFRDTSNVDEIWNYTFAANIARGLVPYRDFNMLQTPAACMISGLVLCLTGRHLIVIRLTGAVLFAGIAVLLSRGFRWLGTGRAVSLLPGVLFLLEFQYNVFFEYSCLIVFCQLVMLCADLRIMEGRSGRSSRRRCADLRVMEGSSGRPQEHRTDEWFSRYNTDGTAKDLPQEHRVDRWFRSSSQFFLGIFGGIAVMSKQTYGGFVMAAAWISVILVSRWLGCGVRERLRLLFFRMLGSSVPCFLVLFYLLANHAWGDFMDYCVYGISTFSTKWTPLQFLALNTENKLVGAAFLLLILIGLWCVIRRRDRRAGLILLCGLAGCINLYPLANSYHVITCMVTFLLLAAIGWVRIRNRLEETLMREQITGIPAETDTGESKAGTSDGWGIGSWDTTVSVLAILAACFFVFLWNPVSMLKNCRWNTEIDQLEGILIPKNEYDADVRMTQQIGVWLEEGQEVYILDNHAEWYLTPWDCYHRNLDMFLYGNLGTETPEECLEDTLAEPGIYLLPDESRSQYQYPRTAVQQFQEKYLRQVGTLEDFRVYVAK